VTKRRIILLALAGALLVTVTLVWSFRGPSAFYQGRSVPEWASELRAPDPAVQERASTAIKTLGIQAVPDLIRLVKTRDPGLRRLAWDVAKRLPRRLRAWYFREVRWPDPNEACIAGAKGLGLIGPDAQRAIPALSAALHSPNQGVSLEAAAALARIGAASIPVLEEALKDKTLSVRHAAVFALGEIGAGAQRALPLVIPLLKETDPTVRSSAAYSVGRIGVPDLQPLAELLGNQDAGVRQTAANLILRHYGSWRGIPPGTATRLGDVPASGPSGGTSSDGVVRATRAATLALQDKELTVRLGALTALSRLPSTGSESTALLVGCLKDESPRVREYAARLLGQKGPSGADAVPGLTGLLDDKDDAVKAAAAFALKALQQTPTK
jgi:HEAT repeat protein